MVIKELRALIQACRMAGTRPRVHGNGFIQLDLSPSKRLHVWGDSRIPRQAVPSPIHDHTFSFTSRIISGKLIHRTIAITPDRDGAYRLYKAEVRHGEDTRLVLQPLRQMAVIVDERLLRAGDSYAFKAGLFHETIAPWPCVTVIEKDGPSLAQGGPAPRVLVPEGLTPDNDFDRYATPPELLWQIIEEALAARLQAPSANGVCRCGKPAECSGCRYKREQGERKGLEDYYERFNR